MESMLRFSVKKSIAILAVSLIFIFFQLCGCAFKGSPSEEGYGVLPSGPLEEGEELPDDRNEEPGEALQEESATPVGAEQERFVFIPKVMNLYMEDVYGKTMCDTWYRLVDAVMAGEDTFECPDSHTYDWVMGQFPEFCFPVLTEIITYAMDRDNSVVDGVARFTYLVSKDEAEKRIEEFARLTESILNEALEPDFSDLEKALALYCWFSDHYEYDYETEEKMRDVYVDYTGTLRFMRNGKGICHEISAAYSYLLMQAGVDATVMSGTRTYDLAGHQWSYVRIGGRDYHIDPTYAICDRGSMRYFMMDDGQREAADLFDSETFYITSNYSRENPHAVYTADDRTFSALWDCSFKEMKRDEHKIVCLGYGPDGEETEVLFDYTGY